MTQENSEKLSALYEVYEQPMYRIAFAVLHDQGLAEDAVSEAFLRLIGKLQKLGDCNSDRTKNYIIKVIKSTSINIYRRNKKTILFGGRNRRSYADSRSCSAFRTQRKDRRIAAFA
ncbi:sigma factor [Ruminococcus sp.]|uniref:sigma factor n=1 Tax=Ruminococcus sp. TaxID=41978 RepID=UPI002B931A82|nr:sigma factor [Ruminococcus sp.]HOH87028.1 sigma factor [Ruminococcus sp.]